MTEEFDRLKMHLGEIMNLRHAGQVLNWDESTYMPRAGAEARGSQMATVSRIARRDYEQERKVPSSLVAEIEMHSARAYAAWTKAREENDFAAFAPYLEKTIELSRRVAEHLGYEDQLYDALLDIYEPGMK